MKNKNHPKTYRYAITCIAIIRTAIIQCCTTGSSWSISSGDIVSVHAAIGLRGLSIHEEIHLFTPDLF